jgi:hypothetical protein
MRSKSEIRDQINELESQLKDTDVINSTYVRQTIDTLKWVLKGKKRKKRGKTQ